MKTTTIPETMTPHEAMIHAADTAVAGVGDGRISKDDADALIDIYHKNPDETTLHSLKHVRNNYKWTRSAAEHLASVVHSFSILPIPAPDVFGKGSRHLGVVSKDDNIHIFFKGDDSNWNDYFYHRIWNPFTKATSVKKIVTKSGVEIDSTWGISAEVLEESIYLVRRGPNNNDFAIYAGHLKDGVYEEENLLNKMGWKTGRNPSTALLGETVYLCWIAHQSNEICLGSYDTNKGGYKLLFNSISKAKGASGYETAGFTPAIYPVLVNEMDGDGKLHLRQKIMIVWTASQKGNEICCTFYDTSSGELSEVQPSGGFCSMVAISKNQSDGKLQVLGTTYQSKGSNYFWTMKYEVNENSAGGKWSKPGSGIQTDGNYSEYCPAVLEFGADRYAFVIDKDTLKITYQDITQWFIMFSGGNFAIIQ